MAIDTPQSASAVQPIKEVGRNDALSGVLSTAAAPNPPPATHSQPTGEARTKNKRVRDRTSDKDEKEEVEEKAPPSSSSSSSSSSPAAVPTPVSYGNNSDSKMNDCDDSPHVDASSSSDFKSFVSITTRRDTLATRANIDCRSYDELVVSVRVNAHHPDGAPTIARMQYTSGEEGKRKCAIKFIGSATGLHISCPIIPRYLLQSGNAFTSAVENLTAVQRVWHDELMARVTGDFDIIRSGFSKDEVIADACEWLWAHLVKAVPMASRPTAQPLWNDRALTTESWEDLLNRAGTAVLRDFRPTPSSEFHSYQLRLRCANSALTHVVACQLLSYSLLRSVEPNATKEWDAILGRDCTGRSNGKSRPTDATDSSSSDTDDGWVQSKATRKRAEQRERRAQSLPKRVADFRSKFMIGTLAGRCSAETQLPLLALSANIRVRAWEERYTSCLVDNFESMGCDVSDLSACPLFQKISTSIPGLTPPTAAWCINQHNGGADVTIFIREDSKETLLTLNAKAQTLFPGMSVQLRIKCSVLESNSRGRINRFTPRRSIFLNEQVPVTRRPVIPANQRVTAVSYAQASSPPPPGSWAAAVLHGVKRLPDLSTLNHRPKKKTSDSTNANDNGGVRNTVPPKSQQQPPQKHQQQPKSSPTAATTQPTASNTTAAAAPLHQSESVAWQELEARNAAMEQRLNEMQAASSSMLERLTRSMESITVQLAEQQRTFALHLQEQMAVNASFRAALEQIVQRLQVPQPASFSEVLSRSHPASPIVTEVRSNTLQSHLISGVNTVSSQPSTLISEASASASPARNGLARSHG
jgi:hypothetical protein